MMRKLLTAGLLGICSLALAVPIGATPALPKAMTPSLVAKAVHDSAGVKAVTSSQRTVLSSASSDTVGKYYRSLAIGCYWLKDPCVFGSTTTKKTLVLFGDSHAGMWAPAIIPAATSAGYRVYVVWFPNCPVADFVPYVAHLGKLAPECAAWRSLRMSQIAALSPTIVLLSESTTFAFSAANVPVSADDWQSALERSIQAVKGSSTKVVVLGDIPFFNQLPATCMALHPTAIGSCSTSVVNPLVANRQLNAAEAAAAAAQNAAFVDPDRWLCAIPTTCAPLIANTVVYSDADHIAASYAAKIRNALWGQILAAKP